MTTALIDIEAGCFRPAWTNPNAIGWIIGYIDCHSEDSIEDQMVRGYEMTAGIAPYEWEAGAWEIRGDTLVALRYPEDAPYREVSRTLTPLKGGLEVRMYEAAMTAIVGPGDRVLWVARLD